MLWYCAGVQVETPVPSVFEKEYSMKKSIQTRHLVFLSLCVCGGMIAKRVVTPVLNPLTDLIRLPGGGAAAAFSLLFIVLGCTVTDWPFAATLAALVQGTLAFALGMTGYQGAFTLLTYTVPGVATDIVRRFTPKGSEIYFFFSCCLGNLLCAVVSNLLVFHLRSLTLFLWLLVAACFGGLAGTLGHLIYRRLEKAGVL